MRAITFTVAEVGQPQGSSNAYKRGNRIVVVSANKKLKPFRDSVHAASIRAIAQLDGGRGGFMPLFGKHWPVSCEIAFTFVRPKSVKPSKRPHMTVTPDLDKCARGVFDALTGSVWHDDSQVVRLTCSKAYGDSESVTITVSDYVQPA